MKKTRLINKLNNSKINTSTNKTNNNPITKHLQTILYNKTIQEHNLQYITMKQQERFKYNIAINNTATDNKLVLWSLFGRLPL